MSKTIPVALQTHKNLTVTTLCRLLLIICKDGDYIGLTTLDVDVEYNPGDTPFTLAGVTPPGAEITFRSASGFGMSRISSTAGTGVDNAEARGLLADLDTLGFTEEQVRAGKLDYANAWVFEVNYNDLTAERHEIIARGKAGEASIHDEALRLELRSLSQLLRQNTTQVTSLTCRTQYGSTQCGATLAWDSGTVSGVSISEGDRIFTDSGSAEVDDYYVPGVVRWLTGDNAGAEVEVEQYASGAFTLARPLYFPIVIGDTYEARIDCPKTVAGCKARGRFPNNFRGEHLIPVDREGELLTPGAGL